MTITRRDLHKLGYRVKDGTAVKIAATDARKPGERIDGVYRSKLERDYARYLDLLKSSGEVQSYHYEAIKIRYTQHNFYEPDFKVVYASGQVEVVECKGFVREDDAIKCNAAATILWPWKIVMVRRVKNMWVRREF